MGTFWHFRTWSESDFDSEACVDYGLGGWAKRAVGRGRRETADHRITMQCVTTFGQRLFSQRPSSRQPLKTPMAIWPTLTSG